MNGIDSKPASVSAIAETWHSKGSTNTEHVSAVRNIVSIVGAGPGPVDLSTVRAFRRIQHAEVVVHDRLLSPDVLDLVPAGAIKIDVGSAPSQHSMLQRDIEDTLVRWCRSGRAVVRLKGGEPFVFGRGGKEIRVLTYA